MLLWQDLYTNSGFWGLSAFFPLYLYALLRGDSIAKRFAHLFMLAALLGTMLASSDPAGLPLAFASQRQLGLDTLLLAAQIVLTLRSPWLYPIAISAAQLLIVLADAIAASGLITQPGTMWLLVGIPAFIQLVTFVAGLVRHRRRLPRKLGKPGFATDSGRKA